MEPMPKTKIFAKGVFFGVLALMVLNNLFLHIPFYHRIGWVFATLYVAFTCTVFAIVLSMFAIVYFAVPSTERLSYINRMRTGLENNSVVKGWRLLESFLVIVGLMFAGFGMAAGVMIVFVATWAAMLVLIKVLQKEHGGLS